MDMNRSHQMACAMHYHRGTGQSNEHTQMNKEWSLESQKATAYEII